jgi:hypothetical protein
VNPTALLRGEAARDGRRVADVQRFGLDNGTSNATRGGVRYLPWRAENQHWSASTDNGSSSAAAGQRATP